MLKYILFGFCIIFFSAGIIFADLIPPEIYQGGVLFKYDDANASRVSVAGTFSDWNADKYQMQKNEEGIWVTKLFLKPGNYEYKFVINGNWMDGANLKLKIVQESDGSLNIPEIKPPSNIPHSDKIYIDGNYYAYMENVKNRYGNYRENKPQHDLDLNFWITVKPEIEAFAQLNVNNLQQNGYYTTLDKAHLKLESKYFDAAFYKNERVVDYDNVSHILDEYSPNFDDNIYVYGEQRSVYKKFGKYMNLFYLESNKLRKDLNVDLFFSDNNNRGDDLNSLRIRYASAFGLNFDAIYLNHIFDNGVEYNPGSGNSYAPADDYEGWINLMRGYGWQHYDVFRRIGDSNSGNSMRNILLDINYPLNKKITFYVEYCRNNKNSAGVAYMDGIGDTVDNNSVGWKYVLAGESYSSDKFIAGITTKLFNNKLLCELSYSFEDMSLQTIDNTETHAFLNVSPTINDFCFKAKYNRKNYYINFIGELYNLNNIGAGIYYKNFDEYDFTNLQLEGVDKVSSFKLYSGTNFKLFKKLFNWNIKCYYDDYGINYNPMLKDINTYTLKNFISWNFFDDFTLNFMYRYKNYDVKNYLLSAKGLSESFNFFEADITYNLSKNIFISFGYNLSLIPDEERNSDMPYFLYDKFITNTYHSDQGGIGGNTISQIIAAEKAVENSDRFIIRANVKF